VLPTDRFGPFRLSTKEHCQREESQVHWNTAGPAGIMLGRLGTNPSEMTLFGDIRKIRSLSGVERFLGFRASLRDTVWLSYGRTVSS